jgi:hypothetical protein
LNTWAAQETDHPEDYIDCEPIFLDAVECNSLMPIYSEQQGISDNAERYTILALSLLYSAITPFATTIVWIFLILDAKISRRLSLKCMQRSRPEFEKNIDSWNYFAEVISLCAVLSNCLLLYTFTGTFRDVSLFAEYSIDKLTIVVGIEHALFLLVILMKTFIPDMSLTLKKRIESMKVVTKMILSKK